MDSKKPTTRVTFMPWSHQQSKTQLIILLCFITLMKANAQISEFDSLANEINKTAIFNRTKSLEMLEKLYLMARQSPDSTLLLAHCYYEDASLNYRQGIVDTLLTIEIKNKLAQKPLPLQEYALLQSALGTNLVSEKGYADAFPLHFQALEAFEQLNDNRFIARVLNSLGNICYYFDLQNLAENYYTEAIAHISPEYHEYYYIKINCFRMQSMLQDDESSIDSLCALLEVVNRNNYEELIPVLYLNIGASLFEKDPKRAYDFLEMSLSFDFENPKWLSVIHSYLGLYYAGAKDYQKALYYSFEAMKTMEENNDFYNLRYLYDNISSIYEQQQQYEKALLYSKKNQTLTFRLRSDLVAIETYQKYADTFLDTSKNELIIAEQTIQLKNKQSLIIVILAVFSLLLVLLILLFTHKQKQLKISENRELSEKLENEKRVQQYEKRQRKLEKEKQEEVINAKTRELTSYSLLVSNKNMILKQITDFTAQIFDNKDNSIKIAKKINEIIQNNLNIDEEWENFKMHFDKVHPDFFEKLKQACDSLTEENLRMCAYIKIRLTNKQIAQLLHVIPNTVITSRYRLKKKLQLADDEDLDCFISKL